MKKTYIIPATISLGSLFCEVICDSRMTSGGPTNTGGLDLPTTVGETDGELDPYDDHGQGNGGSGNRAPERWGSLW